MNEILLLGAGASIEADVPGAFEMTKSILAKFRTKTGLKKHSHALSFVAGGLLFSAGQNNKNPLESMINIEDLFNAIKLLAERNSLEIAPFVGSWHSFIDELDKTYPPMPTANIQKIIYESIAKELIDALSAKPDLASCNRLQNAIIADIKRIAPQIAKGPHAQINGTSSISSAISECIAKASGNWISRLRRPSNQSSEKADTQIVDTLNAILAKPGDGEIFSEINTYMTLALKELVWIGNPVLVKYLSPILNLLKQSDDNLTIATLNYDNSIEQLSESYQINCETGIESWSETGALEFSKPGIDLIKLHGSIDWKRDCETIEHMLKSPKYIKIAPSDVKEVEYEPAVIFGDKNKLTADGPYLDLLRQFQSRLEQSNTLTVIGYSFRDSHINVYISKWLNGSNLRKVRIINGRNWIRQIDSSPEENKYALELLKFSGENLGRIEILQMNAGEALEQLYQPYSLPQTISVPLESKSAFNEKLRILERANELLESIKGFQDIAETEDGNSEPN
jgi:hypothetical protein